MPSPVKALLDANVLYSNHLRNLLLQMAQNYEFDVKWSSIIEDEWLRNMEPTTRERIASKTITLIRTWFEDAIVEGFDPNREIGKTDPKDRHVASAAAAIAPSKLVTLNLKHFDFAALADLGVALQTPDEFLCGLFDGNPELIEAVTREAAANLSRTLGLTPNPIWKSTCSVGLRRYNPPEFRSWLGLAPSG